MGIIKWLMLPPRPRVNFDYSERNVGIRGSQFA